LGHTRETGPDRVRTHLRFRPTHLHDCKGRLCFSFRNPQRPKAGLTNRYPV
jgi:hypothetical protein